MNRKPLIVAAVALLTGTAAFAQEATPDTWMQVASTQTRADVQAALARARADGSIKFASAGYIEKIAAPKTRAEVRAELEQARASGELAAINAEVYTTERNAPMRLARSAR